jgi:hypothetical protein
MMRHFSEVYKLLLYGFCIVTLVIQGCQRKNNLGSEINEFQEFERKINLTGQVIHIDVDILKPQRMITVDSFLIIGEGRPDSIFTIFKTPNLEHLISFGNAGRGPDEFNGTWLTTSFTPVYSSDSRFAVANQSTNVNYYKISDLLNRNITPYYVSKPPPGIQTFQAMACISDSVIVGMPYGGMGGKTFLFKHDNTNNSLEHFKDYPIDFPNLSNDDRSNLFSCFLTVKKDNTKFALVYNNIGKIEIYNLTSNYPITIVYTNFPDIFENLDGLETNSLRVPRNSHVFSWQIKSSDSYIYVQVFGCEYEKISDGRGLRRSEIFDIHVFDWDGNSVALLKPDRFYEAYAIDPEDKYLYTIHPDSANSIMRYKLDFDIN